MIVPVATVKSSAKIAATKIIPMRIPYKRAPNSLSGHDVSHGMHCELPIDKLKFGWHDPRSIPWRWKLHWESGPFENIFVSSSGGEQ